MLRLALVLPVAVLLAAGCGYHLAGAGTERVAVAVPTLVNDSLEPGVELVLAAALRRELDRSVRFRVVESARGGAYAVRGRVAAVDTQGRTFTPGVRALEYTVTVQLDVTVAGPDGGAVPIDPFATRGTEVYLASTDIEISRKNRDEALRRVSALLAARIRRELERAVEETAAAPRADRRAVSEGRAG